MSWVQTLADHYDQLTKANLENPGSYLGIQPPATINQNAQLEIVISQSSELLRAHRVPKEDAKTTVPVTEKSAARTSGVAPHPLFDNLEYMAGDLVDYFHNKAVYEERFQPYIHQLSDWVTNDPTNQEIRIIYDYLSQETLVQDLLKLNVLTLDDHGFLDRSDKHQGNEQHKFLIRIAIETEGDAPELWNDTPFMQKWSEFYMHHAATHDEGLCYVTGISAPLGSLHGKGIRYAGDGAKLISSNDKSNFTFRGRFREAEEAVGISYETSEKAHSALRWLIRNQSYLRNGYVVLAFGMEDDVKPFDDTESVKNSLLPRSSQYGQIESGHQFLSELKEAIRGRSHTFVGQEKVSLMTLDNATPGRLAIQYYREFSPKDYLENVAYYHDTMAWVHRYKRGEDKKIYSFVGVPQTIDLVTHVFGNERNGFMTMGDQDKYLNQLMQRMLPCITERARIPRDFVEKSIDAAVTPLSKSAFNWQRCVSICCGMVNKYAQERKGVKYEMALDKNLNDRSYLFGRLLAVAEKIERDVYQKEQKGSYDRQTNAMRYMSVMSKKPYRTWMILEQKIQPYLRRLGQSKNYYQHLIGEIMDLFTIGDYTTNKALEGTFVLGFHCQLQDFYKKRDVSNQVAEELED